MENSLLKLSRAYEKGSISKDTYRKRRAEYIHAVLEGEESDRTVTNRRYMAERGIEPASAQTNVNQESSATDTGNADKPKPNLLMPGAAVAVIVVIALIFMSGGGDDARESGTHSGTHSGTQTAVVDPVSMEAVEVLKGYTDEILRDGELDFDESDKFIEFWSNAPEAEKDRWLSYSSDMMIRASAAGNKDVVDVLDSLYFELDVPPPASLVREEVSYSSIGTPSNTPSVNESSSQYDPTSSVAETTPEVGSQTLASQQLASPSTQTPSGQALSSDVKTAIAERASANQNTDTSIEKTSTQSDNLKENLVTAIDSQRSKPEPKQVSTSESSSPKSADVKSQVAKVVPDNVPQRTDDAPAKSIAPIAATAAKPSIDLRDSFNALHNSGLELEAISTFLFDWQRRAGRQDRTNFVNQVDRGILNEVRAATTQAVGRYGTDFQRDTRYEALVRLSSLLGRVVGKLESEQAQSEAVRPAAVSDIRRRPGDNYTIQLFVSDSEARVQQLVQEHANLGLYYVQAEQDNARTYILLEGNYSKKASADQRKLTLPQIGDSNSWSRTNSDLLGVMN